MKKKNPISGKAQKGQALIIILLVMAVVMTVVLSAVSRSVTEVSVTSYEENALRAFSAAEAGIEEKLLNPTIGTFGMGPGVFDTTDTSVYYSGDVTQPAVPNRQFKYPNKLLPGETATFWLVSQDANGNLTCSSGDCWKGSQIRVCYGASGASPEPAIEVSVYYDDTSIPSPSVATPNNYSGVKVRRYLFDFLALSRGGGENSVNSPCNFVDGSYFRRRGVIDTWGTCSSPLGSVGCILFVTVRMLYSSDQPVGAWLQGGATNMPAQGIFISSTGVAGDSSRKVDVFRSHPESPNLFDLAVFSGSDLSK